MSPAPDPPTRTGDEPDGFSRWRPHPWHGLARGAGAPGVMNAYIEITPFDLVKYELDKVSGYLRVDRPQRTSSLPPALYGFIPRTYSGARVGELMEGAGGGDEDPLDICVLSERPINRAEVIVEARIIGGIPMLDGGLADDKIVAVLRQDALWEEVEDMEGLPEALSERLLHYFATYKLVPGRESDVEIRRPYGRERAIRVVEAAVEDYEERFR